MTTFLLVRHAEADYSGPMKWGVTGWGGDIAPLTQKGIEQVKIKGPGLAEFKPDIILTSSMSRAVQTVLLLNKYMDFIVENEFRLLISLDGDKNNNIYRLNKFAKGSSFDKVYSNIKLLQKNHPEYFNKNVQFNAVLHNKYSIGEIHNFFKY